MKLPNYSAEASLGPSSITYTGAVGSGGRSRGTIVPAADCPPGVDCGWAQFFCFASLDLDPVSCGLYYGCCQGAGKTGETGDVCRNNPCAAGCPSDLCIQSLQSALSSVDPMLSAEFSDLSSQVASLGKQLRRIANCVCPRPDLSRPLVVPWVPPWVSTVSTTARRVPYRLSYARG